MLTIVTKKINYSFLLLIHFKKNTINNNSIFFNFKEHYIMTSSFFGIELGKRGVQNFKRALEVTGNNINNVSTKGYSRQRVIMTSFNKPLESPSLNRAERAGQIGQGMEITTIERIRDNFVDEKMVKELATNGYWDTRFNYLNQMEAIYNEPSDKNLRNDIDAFWSGWQDVANNPTERASRFVIIERGERLNSTVNQMYGQMKGLRDNVNNVLESKIKHINELASSIRDLNVEIQKIQAMGDNPNDYLDKRDLLIDELSKLADVTVKNTDSDETMVYIGSRMLVQGPIVNKLNLVRNAENEGMFDVHWEVDNELTKFSSGEVKALIELRDIDIVQSINDLDAFAVNFADAVNEIHKNGFGINQETGNNFFNITPLTTSVVGNYDLNNDGADDSTMLFKMSGVNTLKATDSIGSNGTLTFGNVSRNGENITINYTEQMKVQDIVDKINTSEANVSAYIDYQGRLIFKARGFDDYLRPNYFIKHVEDSGSFLTGISGMLRTSGADGAFTYQAAESAYQLVGDASSYTVTPYRHPAEAMAINTIIKNDTNYIAASGGISTNETGILNKWNGIGDGSNALDIAALRFKPMMIDSQSTFNDFYTGSISRIATRAETANIEGQKQKVVVGYIEQLRQSISGVNLDEEVAQMVMYQHGYNASARVVNVMDQLLDTIINRMGV